MAHERDRSHPTDAFGLPEGLLAAIAAALLQIGTFAIVSSYTAIPPSEYWVALTAVTILALGVSLPGCAAISDALGRVVQRDGRPLAALAALVPALYAACAFAVRELSLPHLLSVLAFAAVPMLALGAARDSRAPTVLDGVAIGYLLVALSFNGLLPPFALPQQSALVPFFQLAAVPLLLLFYARRGWPGLGYTWHLSGRELRDALLAGMAGALLLGVYGLYANYVNVAQNDAGRMITRAVSAYFFAALPVELLLRGGVQNGLERVLRGPMGATAPWVAMAAVAVLATAIEVAAWWGSGFPSSVLGAFVVSLAAGWVYHRTGKVTASAVTYALMLWIVGYLAGR